MKVAVLELLSGGGIHELIGIPNANSAGESERSEIAQALLREGWAMLHALASDLQQCGHQIFTCLDQELVHSKQEPTSALTPFDHFVCSNRIDWLSQWRQVAIPAEITIVIAPEIDNLLATTVRHLREHGAIVLAPDAWFLKATSDKLLFAEAMLNAKLPHPSTQTLTSFLQSPPAERTGFASASSDGLVLKRRDGAGCADMKRFESDRSFATWCCSNLLAPQPSEANQRTEDLTWRVEAQAQNGESWIVQPWLKGSPRSLAVLAGRSNWILGSVAQRIELSPCVADASVSSVQYAGGYGPLDDTKIQQLELFANRVLNAIPGKPSGWIGIDFLIPDGAKDWTQWVPIEINPRLTTSYLGYRQWYGGALGDMLLRIQATSSSRDDACFHSVDFH